MSSGMRDHVDWSPTFRNNLMPLSEESSNLRGLIEKAWHRRRLQGSRTPLW